MRPCSPTLKVSGNSKRWLERQSRDPYVRQRVSESQEFRSRSAFKLLEIDKKYPFLLANSRSNRPRVIVDLGAAPGGWSQVVALKVAQHYSCHPHISKGSETRETSDKVDITTSSGDNKAIPRSTIIIALDLNPIKPIPGVITIQANFLSASGTKLLLSHIPPDASGQKKVDILLSDMATNATGNSTTDNANSVRIAEAVLEFAVQYLGLGGNLCLKFFQSPDAQFFAQNTLRPVFSNVRIVKPRSSRADSSEAYWLCNGWNGGCRDLQNRFSDD